MSAEPILTEEMTAEIRSYFSRYPDRRAVALPALHVVNRHLHYVPLQAVEEIADLLELAPAEVQDTLSFYGYFKQDQPHGQTRLWVCRSISCALRGGDQILERVCQRLGVEPGATTSDGKLTVEYAECLGACEHAPCALANDELHKNLDSQAADDLIESLRHEPGSRGASV